MLEELPRDIQSRPGYRIAYGKVADEENRAITNLADPRRTPRLPDKRPERRRTVARIARSGPAEQLPDRRGGAAGTPCGPGRCGHMGGGGIIPSGRVAPGGNPWADPGRYGFNKPWLRSHLTQSCVQLEGSFSF